MDRFTVAVISQTPKPQQAIYAAMHQDYAEAFVWDDRDQWPDETKCGEIVVKNLLAGNRGHYGPLEHPQIILNCGWFPHSTMQQMRTHRVGVSFDVQCLAGDTDVTFVRASGALKKIKISALYAWWASGETIQERKLRGRREPPGTDRQDYRTRLQKMHLRVLNEETGMFGTSHIQDVFDQGMQPVYRLTLEDGKTIDCTENHRLFTSQGWQTMKAAVALVTDAERQVLAHAGDCYLMTNGTIVSADLYRDRHWLEEQLQAGLKTREMAHHLLPYAYPEKAHDVNNLVTVCQPCHQVIHQQGLELAFTQQDMPIAALPQPKPDGHTLKAHPRKVVQVRYLGMQRTYDLEVAGAWHNFVANGVVVHNSFRYTGQRLLDVVAGKQDVEAVFYLRPVGAYTDRQGKRYDYTMEQRQQDLDWCLSACQRYADRISQGCSEEHARGLIPFDVRQHWVMSANVRSLMHLLDLRWKLDAQLEAQTLCEVIWPHFQAWVPAIADWYETNRLKKARLSP